MKWVVVGIMWLSTAIAFWCHVLAAAAHVEAVERIKDPASRAEFEGAFYRWCKFVSRPIRRSRYHG